MYAIVESGSKQYRIEEGDVIEVELLDAGKDGKIELKNVLFLQKESSVKIGSPFVKGGVVHAELVGEVRGPKVVAYKYKKRKGYRRKVGHRQNYSKIKITAIKD
ncbi:MAG TPA: 50S ribosomal protein L21 [Rhabdochlamydiaceae bacterium]|nr:50S ribosomal protein L21 [Rhabdochlamydiaceae bacterium]